ncbi:MAG: hypothetical protein J5671_06775 [Bacteroidaceae bacterium]|nr:hypothetical protein [Bacteroidaceae bacterium]
MEAKNIFSENANREGWKCNTYLGVDLKTYMRSDRRTKTGREYRGVLRRDWDAQLDEFLCRDAHYTFIECETRKADKRNPRVFEGRYITVTRSDNGSLNPNFKRIMMRPGFNVDGYALEVANEIRLALKGLVESE